MAKEVSSVKLFLNPCDCYCGVCIRHRRRDCVESQVGVQPNLLRLLLTDPVLWVKALFGPCTPYQYRLTGPGRWAGARQAILSQWDRVAQPLRTRAVPEPESRPSFFPSSYLLIFGGTAIAAVLLSRNEIDPLVQGAAQFLDGCKCFLKESWLSGLITRTRTGWNLGPVPSSSKILHVTSLFQSGGTSMKKRQTFIEHRKDN